MLRVTTAVLVATGAEGAAEEAAGGYAPVDGPPLGWAVLEASTGQKVVVSGMTMVVVWWPLAGQLVTVGAQLMTV